MPIVRQRRPHLHVITKELQEEFPRAYYLPDGIFDYLNRPFRVGTIYQPIRREHKGVDLIVEACDTEGVEFDPLEGGFDNWRMVDYYRSLNLYVCASRNEGHSTCVCECLALRVNVASTDVGFASQFDAVYKIPRSVDGVRRAIAHFDTSRQVEAYFWQNMVPQYEKLYRRIINAH
jgi:hypothetical protein